MHHFDALKMNADTNHQLSASKKNAHDNVRSDGSISSSSSSTSCPSGSSSASSASSSTAGAVSDLPDIDQRDEIEHLFKTYIPVGRSAPLIPENSPPLIMISSHNDHTRDNIFFCAVSKEIYDEYHLVLGKLEDKKHRLSADSIPLYGVGEHGIKIGCKKTPDGKKEFYASIKQGGCFRATSDRCIELPYQGKLVFCFIIGSEENKNQQARRFKNSK